MLWRTILVDNKDCILTCPPPPLSVKLQPQGWFFSVCSLEEKFAVQHPRPTLRTLGPVLPPPADVTPYPQLFPEEADVCPVNSFKGLQSVLGPCSTSRAPSRNGPWGPGTRVPGPLSGRAQPMVAAPAVSYVCSYACVTELSLHS